MEHGQSVVNADDNLSATLVMIPANERVASRAAYNEFVIEQEAMSRDFGVLSRSPPISIAYPADQVENPIVFAEHYARVVVRNPTDHVRRLFTVRETRYEKNEIWTPSDALLVESAPSLPDGALFILDGSRSMNPVTILSAKRILASPSWPVVEVPPGACIELRADIFGTLAPGSRLTPGVVTIPLTMSYAEAPSGGKTVLRLPPFQVTVTKEHVAAVKKIRHDIRKYFEQEDERRTRESQEFFGGKS